jgi:hypothetical protein
MSDSERPGEFQGAQGVQSGDRNVQINLYKLVAGAPGVGVPGVARRPTLGEREQGVPDGRARKKRGAGRHGGNARPRRFSPVKATVLAAIIIIAGTVGVIYIENDIGTLGGPQPKGVPGSLSGRQESHGRPSPSSVIPSAGPTSLISPSPSARRASFHLIERTYRIMLAADWGIPSIQGQEKVPNPWEQAAQDLYYRMYAREFVSLDGGRLAFPSTASASYEACRNAKTTPSVSIASQRYQPFCLIGSDGTISLIQIVPPMPNITGDWNPDPVNLEITYWTQSTSAR